jgi:hypothetical protein
MGVHRNRRVRSLRPRASTYNIHSSLSNPSFHINNRVTLTLKLYLTVNLSGLFASSEGGPAFAGEALEALVLVVREVHVAH